MRVDDLFEFMKARHQIYVNRFELKLPKPWTEDPILQNYRFCNIYRELDTETKWFARCWRMPHKRDPDLCFASLVFRLINKHETAEELGYPVPWDPKHFVRVLHARKKRGDKVYSGAYMISTHGAKGNKAEYLAKSLSKIWKDRGKYRYVCGETLEKYHARLMEAYDVGSFLAAQVIADCKYVDKMYHAPDWQTFAASGPGSRRGLNRVLGNPKDQAWKEENWRIEHQKLYDAILPLADTLDYKDQLHAQDLQNSICEFDKYERVRLGEGTPKQRYNGKGE